MHATLSTKLMRTAINCYTYNTTYIHECVIFKMVLIHRRENMDLLAWSHARDTQLSNGPIGASIRVREVPIDGCAAPFDSKKDTV